MTDSSWRMDGCILTVQFKTGRSVHHLASEKCVTVVITTIFKKYIDDIPHEDCDVCVDTKK